MSRIRIDVLNRAGTKTGPGPITSVIDFEHTRRLNRAGSFRFRMPGRDPRASILIAKASLVQFYWDDQGEFTGIVESLRTTLDNQGNILLQVEGRDMLAELAEIPVAYLELAGYKVTHGSVSGGPFTIGETITGGTSGATGTLIYNGTGTPTYVLLNPVDGEFQTGETLTGGSSGATATSVTVVGRTGVPDGPQRILTAANTLAPATWTLDTANGYSTTATDIYAKFAGESALQALIKSAEHVGERFRTGNGIRNIAWLQDEVPDPTVRAIQGAGDPVAAEDNDNICFILHLEEVQDAYELVNRVYPYGSGVGETRLTLAATSRTASSPYALSTASNYIQNSTSISTLGATIARYVEFKSLRPISNTDQDVEAAADALYDAALAWLQRRDEATDNRSFSLEVLKLPAAVFPGDRIRVIYYDDVYSINAIFYVLEITARTNSSGLRTYNVLVSTTDGYPATDADIQAEQIERGIVLSAHPQMNANSYRENFRVYVGEDQASEKADILWWFGPEVVGLQQVLMRFNLTELVSPSTTVGGSASFGIDVTIPNHAHVIPDHQHFISVNESGSAWGNAGVSAPSGGTSFMVHDSSGGGTVNVYTNAASGGTTSETDGGGGTASGTIDVGSALSTDFGIFREDAANTFSVSDLEYQVNGGGWSDLSGATSHGNDWYSIDITGDVQVSATLRPTQEGNLLEVRRKSAGATGKTAMLVGALEIRNIIQGISYT